MSQAQLGTLASGETVVDRPNSHWHKNVSAEQLSDALGTINSDGRRRFEVNVETAKLMPMTCVTTGNGDEIIFAKRRGRTGYTRFVKNRDPETTNVLGIVLRTAQGLNNTYELVTAFWGPTGIVEPWDPRATAYDKEFWRNHALLWESEDIEEGTEITDPSQFPW